VARIPRHPRISSLFTGWDGIPELRAVHSIPFSPSVISITVSRNVVLAERFPPPQPIAGKWLTARPCAERPFWRAFWRFAFLWSFRCPPWAAEPAPLRPCRRRFSPALWLKTWFWLTRQRGWQAERDRVRHGAARGQQTLGGFMPCRDSCQRQPPATKPLSVTA
jgi:hypothetical protein